MILKASHYADLYCEWSSNVGGPTLIGTREEFLEELTRHADLDGDSYHRSCPAISRNDAEEMLKRADETGTSVQHRIGPRKAGAWESDLMYRQEGILPRAALLGFLKALQRHEAWWTEGETPPEALSMIEPFEDR